MIKWLLLLLLLLPSLFALEITVQGGKENKSPFSVIHLKSDRPFLCDDRKNDLDQTREVICIFERRPTQLFKALNNDFFTITSESSEKDFLLHIAPHTKMRLFPLVFNLSRDSEIFRADVSKSAHWMIVGYKETIPFIKDERTPSTAINFPLSMEKEMLPYVGGLDIHGEPVLMTRVKDVNAYISIKRFYDSGNYEKALELAKNTAELYPDTVFKSELLLYKIRCEYKLGQDEALLEVAKKFLRTYSADENVPEVLAYIADAYSEIGLYIDADYFFDRLFTEHDESPFARLGLIFKAQQLEASGNSKKALKYYKRALHETKDPDIAAQAAFELAQYYSEHGEAKEAVRYARKILDGAPSYFPKNKIESLEMAMVFADRGKTSIAADIESTIMSSMSTSEPEYEVLLKNKAIWLAQAERREDAIVALDDYLKRYKYGNFRDQIIRVKDSLFFARDDLNISEQIDDYDALIAQYGADEIGRKALFKKARLLYEAGRYVNVLDMRDALKGLDPVLYPESSGLLKDAAIGMMKQALEKNACTDVISLAQEFDIRLSAQWDAGLFGCAMQGGDYELARSLAAPHLKSKEVIDRMAWLQRYLKAEFALGNYKETVRAAKELITLGELEESSEYLDAYRLLFDATQRLGDEDAMVLAIKDIEKRMGLLYKDIERYTQMVTLGKNRKDSMMIESHATKVITLQDRANSHTQTPYIEFTLIQALLSTKEKKALELLQSLDKRDLTAEQRSRQKYMEGTLLNKTSRLSEAKKAFDAAIGAAPDSAWGKLAEDAISLTK